MTPISLDRRRLLAALAGSTLAGGTWAKGGTPFFTGSRQIGLQLYTLGDEAARDIDGALARLAAIGYRDLELPGLMGKTPAALRAAADRAGVRFSSIHLSAMAAGPDALSMLSPAQRIADALGEMGITSAILPIMLLPDNFRDAPGSSFPEKVSNALAGSNGDIWKRTAALLNERAAALRPASIAVGYHNHNVEFAPVAGSTGWHILLAECDPALVSFELDLGWIAAAGHDPAALLDGLRGRVRWVHVKDLQASTQTNFALRMQPTEVGAGRQDWPRIMAAAARAGVQHYFVEQEPPFAMPRMDAAARSYAFLQRLSL